MDPFTAPMVRTSTTGNPLRDAEARQALERDGLSQFLQRQRWFAGKARQIRRAQFIDWGTLDSRGSAVVLTIVEVRYEDDAGDRYFVPLVLMEQEAAAASYCAFEGMLAQVVGACEGCLCDALADDAACEALVSAMQSSTSIEMFHGRVNAGGAAARDAEPSTLRPVRRTAAEQSNTSVFFGNELVLKLFRRLEVGENPELEVVAFLNESGFPHVPQSAGSLTYSRGGEESTVLAFAQAFVVSQGSCWDHAVRAVHHCLELVASDGGGLEAHAYLPVAARLGQRTAELHEALSSNRHNPAFAPEPLTMDDLVRMASEMQKRAQVTFDLLDRQLRDIPDGARPAAERVLAERALVTRRFRELQSMPGHAMKIRVHGDYHLGQVLSVDDDFIIIDFEGEPSRSLAERRRKQSAVQDIAGMLRSFSYAAHTGLTNFEAEGPIEFERAELAAAAWAASTSRAFLKTYLAASSGQSFMPANRETFDTLLGAFMMDKVLYELHYELDYRPERVSTPLWGIGRLLASDADVG